MPQQPDFKLVLQSLFLKESGESPTTQQLHETPGEIPPSPFFFNWTFRGFFIIL